MTKPSATIFLISLKAGGVALNLTEASRVFICDPWWNPVSITFFLKKNKVVMYLFLTIGIYFNFILDPNQAAECKLANDIFCKE
jgi:hypothetical protein